MIFALNSGTETLPKRGDGLVRKKGAVVKARGVHFAWNQADSSILTIEKFVVEPGERLFVEGPSGCGKSTLISLLAGVNRASAGSIDVMGQNLNHMKSSERDVFRADHIGVIFQMFNLLPYLSVIENVTLPCMFSDHRKQKVLETAESHELEATRLGSQVK